MRTKTLTILRRLPVIGLCLGYSVAAIPDTAASFRGDATHSGLSSATGVPQLHGVTWKFKTNGPVVSSPAVSNGTVYVGSYDHYVYAINQSDGKQRWAFKTQARVTSSPAVHAGRVFISSFDGNLYALDAKTGALRWKFKTGNVVHASPTVVNDTVYIGSWDSYFYALDAKTGKERWRFKTGEDHDIYNQVGIQSSAVVSGGLVFFGCRDANLYALNAATGEKVWSYANDGSWVISTPIVKDDTLYFATSDSGLFHALDIKSGKPKYTLSFKHWPMFSSPAIAGQVLYIGSHSGTLMAIDLNLHSVAWTFRTEGSLRNAAAITQSDGEVNYKAVFDGSFYDDLVVGVWRMMSIGAVLSSPAIDRDVLYFGSTDGNVYALN